MLKVLAIFFSLVQKYHRTLKSNIRIVQTAVFHQVGVIMLYSFFQQSNFILFLPTISAFDTLMTVIDFRKIAICQATA